MLIFDENKKKIIIVKRRYTLVSKCVCERKDYRGKLFSLFHYLNNCLEDRNWKSKFNHRGVRNSHETSIFIHIERVNNRFEQSETSIDN